jgi:hypothetical protein
MVARLRHRGQFEAITTGEDGDGFSREKREASGDRSSVSCR